MQHMTNRGKVRAADYYPPAWTNTTGIESVPGTMLT